MALHLKYAAAAIGLLRKLFFFYVCFFVVFIFIGGYFGLFFVILPLEN